MKREVGSIMVGLFEGGVSFLWPAINCGDYSRAAPIRVSTALYLREYFGFGVGSKREVLRSRSMDNNGLVSCLV